jgi:hypothetical protein
MAQIVMLGIIGASLVVVGVLVFRNREALGSTESSQDSGEHAHRNRHFVDAGRPVLSGGAGRPWSP